MPPAATDEFDHALLLGTLATAEIMHAIADGRTPRPVPVLAQVTDAQAASMGWEHGYDAVYLPLPGIEELLGEYMVLCDKLEALR